MSDKDSRYMDEKTHAKSKVFSRLKPAKCEHLKPLSVYSRMIAGDQKAGLHRFSYPFVNFKVEIMNNCERKRKPDDSCPDDGYGTPSKRTFNLKALSPDLGFMDYSSPSARQDSVSPYAISKPALFNETQDIRSEIKQTMSSQLQSEHVECVFSGDSGDSKGTVPHSLEYEEVLFNVAPDFDCDVGNILCLSPDNVESCKSPSGNTVQNTALLIPAVAHRQELKRGDGQVEEEREELKKEMDLNVKDVEEDKGYFSMSYIKGLKTGKDPSQSGYPQLPPATSSPLLRRGEVEALEDDCHPESSSEPRCHEQAALAGQHISFKSRDLCPIVSGPLLESRNSPIESLEGDVEEVWSIGLPIFQSSMCHNVTVILNASSEQSRQVSDEVQGGMMDSVLECQATLGGEEATLDTSYETTLPPQVQVKSVVVVPRQQPSCSKPTAPPLPKRNAKPTKPSPKENRASQPAECVGSASSHRPVSLCREREVDLEQKKQAYLRLVSRHLNENPQADREDVTTELWNLMDHVADQTPGTSGMQWQHPSDLTRRNYQRQFGNMIPTMTLHEWQAKNSTTCKRFAKVPKIFQRSQYP